MITKEEFTKLISDNVTHNKRIYEVESVLKWHVFDWDLVEYGNLLFDLILGILFEKEAVNNISWWVFERRFDPDLKILDKDGKEMPTETIEDLWNIVKDYRK